MDQLSGMDAMFLYMEQANAPMHVGSLVIYDQSTAPEGVVRFKEILAHMEARLGFARAFRQKLVKVPFGLDRPYWVEDANFDLEFHVRHLALPRPGDWRQLCIQTARLMSRPLDLTRPLWELTVIEGLDAVEGYPSGCYAIVSKMHHAAIDGMSGAEIFAAVHDLEPGVQRTPDDSWRPESDPDPVELTIRAATNNLLRPFRGLEAIGRSIPTVGRVVQRLRRGDLELPDAQVRATRFNDTVSSHRVFEGRRFRLDDLKRIRKAVPDATVNDAVIAVIGGALRRYLDDLGELPSESLVTMAPISTRTAERASAAGNDISMMLVPMGTDLADPLERLAAIHEATDSSKELDRAIGAQALTDFARYGPMRLATRAARLYSQAGLLQRTGLPMHCIITNVPGPQIPLYMDNAKVLSMYGLGPITDGAGLIHPIFSYNGEVTISFTGCRAQLPDPSAYADRIEESFTELLEAATRASEPAVP